MQKGKCIYQDEEQRLAFQEDIPSPVSLWRISKVDTISIRHLNGEWRTVNKYSGKVWHLGIITYFGFFCLVWDSNKELKYKETCKG